MAAALTGTDLELAHRLAAWLARDRAALHPHRPVLRAVARAGAVTRETAKACRAIDGANASALRSCMAQGLVRARVAGDGCYRYWLTDAGVEAAR